MYKEVLVIVEYIIETIKALKKDKPLIIVFDGVDTSGKTTLANSVFESMQEQKLFNPLRIQIDKFHNSRNVRIQKGDLSPEGFFYDSFDHKAIFQNIINPIKISYGKLISQKYDYRIEEEIKPIEVSITNNTIILFDGIFMNRDEFYQKWDLSIFLDVSFDTVLKRALKRDIDLFGDKDTIKKRYLIKYIPGQKIYLEKCKPLERADIVIDNNDYLNPKLLKKWTQE
ncbi:MAG: hypothetical protein KAS53_02645 [Candidatus Cloacimonetes bacterium]|nr:hypothetical protein [Candidatus Cloacimonadota bacterium]